jgi:hypothetical protein
VTRSSRLVAALLCAAVLVVASACSPGSGASSSAGSTTPTVDESTTGSPPAGADAPVGFSRVTLIVTRPDGIVEVHCVWLADTVELRDLGLMGITDPDMGGPGAMVFRFDRDSSLPFWMKDTILPLSIAYAGVSSRRRELSDVLGRESLSVGGRDGPGSVVGLGPGGRFVGGAGVGLLNGPNRSWVPRAVSGRVARSN